MPIDKLPIFTYYNVQRFTQMGCMDCANWYGIQVEDTKNGQALYPAMGRKHINYFGENKLVFDSEPSQLFRSINYVYVIVGTRVIQVDKQWNQRLIGSVPLGKQTWFDFLTIDDVTYAILTAETAMYLITENADGTVAYQQITDIFAPTKPSFVVAFGGRFVVSQKDTPQFFISANDVADLSNPANTFHVNGAPLFMNGSGVVRQLGILQTQMYVFCDFVTDIFANIPNTANIGGVSASFPFKKNTSYGWDYGIEDPFSLSIDFGRIAFLAKNSNGLVSFMVSDGQQPVDISSQAINVLLENSRDADDLSPFLTNKVDGFLYQYENTIFYHVSAGAFDDFGELDRIDSANALEYNFSTKTWARVIELNGERNRNQKHVFFKDTHLVTVSGDGTVYKMGGNIYYNELRTPNTLPQDLNAFTKYPFRYKLVTEQIFQQDYSEFLTDYVEIDFVFGDKTFYKNNTAFLNTQFIITEDAAPDTTPVFQITEDPLSGEPVFIIDENGNTPTFDDSFYNSLFKPHIELYYSDDGGITFETADLREFSQLGEYRWRMRWYELGASRNRAYKLICISSAPIVILGGVQSIRRASGGAN
jgi:hypothetical protein